MTAPLFNKLYNSEHNLIWKTSNFKTIVDKKYVLDIKHSLSLCEDFSVEIHLNIVTGIKNLNIHVQC